MSTLSTMSTLGVKKADTVLRGSGSRMSKRLDVEWVGGGKVAKDVALSSNMIRRNPEKKTFQSISQSFIRFRPHGP